MNGRWIVVILAPPISLHAGGAEKDPAQSFPVSFSK
jgi:hypothetical protein